MSAPTETPTVAVVDDHALVVDMLARSLDRVGLVSTAVSPRPFDQLLAQLVSINPTIVVLDLDLGGFGDSVPLIGRLVEHDLRVVILTGETNRIRLAEALEAGAVRVVTKSAKFDDLVTAIRDTAVFNGVRRDPQAARLAQELAQHRMQAAAEREPFDRLTEREQATLQELASGQSVAQIAEAWTVAETTVRSHVRAILTKLDCRSQLQAVVRAVHAGWISPEAD